MELNEHYPPLISPRSPSYERASREFLHPTTTRDPQVAALLARLNEAEQNASQACTGAAQRLRDEAFASEVREHAAMHRGRRQALVKLMEAFGGSAPSPDECREILVCGLDAVAQAQSDAAIRRALNEMRSELSAIYDRAIASTHLTDAQRAALAKLAPATTTKSLP